MLNVMYNKYDPKIYNLGDPKISDHTTRQLKNGPQVFSELAGKHSAANPFKDSEFGYNNDDFGNLEVMFDSAKEDSQYNDWKGEGWDGTVEWLRVADVVKMGPGDLVGDERVVFKYGPSCKAISRSDIVQGIIGNCWFVAALGTVTCNKYLIDSIVPDDNEQSLEAGILHFRFWFQGYWVDVVVDDTLPCVRHNFGKNLWPLSSSIRKQDDVLECWVPFIEKAYAKLHGSYENLVGNNMKYAFENLTGGLIESQEFHDESRPVPPGLYDYLKSSFNQDTIQAIACHEAVNGLCAPHAYSITGFGEVVTKDDGQTVQLVRIRNPHGGGEWNGDWSDKDETNWARVSPEQRKSLELEKEEDGEFWMSYSDMLKYFAVLDICYWAREDKVNQPDSKVKFLQVNGSWTLARGGEGANFLEGAPEDCPQYGIQVDGDSEENCHIIISLGIKQSISDSYAPGPIGVRVFAVDKSCSMKKLDKKFFEQAKEMERLDNASISDPGRVTLRGFSVPPGKYVICPFINDGKEAKFYMRILCSTKPKPKK